jgi:hypothetical protein
MDGESFVKGMTVLAGAIKMLARAMVAASTDTNGFLSPADKMQILRAKE